MEQLLLAKIEALVQDLQNSPFGWIKAVDFYHNNPAAIILQDQKGWHWFKYVLKRHNEYGFQKITIGNRTYFVLNWAVVAFCQQFGIPQLAF
jgi:hypothetical protein